MKLAPFGYAFLGSVVGVGIVASLGFAQGSPWVRLQTLFSPNAQSGHVSVDGTVGANGISLQDNARGEGFIMFPGEAPITSRADLQGPPGAGGLIAHLVFSGPGGFESDGGVPTVLLVPNRQVTLSDEASVLISFTGEMSIFNVPNIFEFFVYAQYRLVGDEEWTTIDTFRYVPRFSTMWYAEISVTVSRVLSSGDYEFRVLGLAQQIAPSADGGGGGHFTLMAFAAP